MTRRRTAQILSPAGPCPPSRDAGLSPGHVSGPRHSSLRPHPLSGDPGLDGMGRRTGTAPGSGDGRTPPPVLPSRGSERETEAGGSPQVGLGTAWQPAGGHTVLLRRGRAVRVHARRTHSQLRMGVGPTEGGLSAQRAVTVTKGIRATDTCQDVGDPQLHDAAGETPDTGPHGTGSADRQRPQRQRAGRGLPGGGLREGRRHEEAQRGHSGAQSPGRTQSPLHVTAETGAQVCERDEITELCTLNGGIVRPGTSTFIKQLSY